MVHIAARCSDDVAHAEGQNKNKPREGDAEPDRRRRPTARGRRSVRRVPCTFHIAIHVPIHIANGSALRGKRVRAIIKAQITARYQPRQVKTVTPRRR